MSASRTLRVALLFALVLCACTTKPVGKGADRPSSHPHDAAAQPHQSSPDESADAGEPAKAEAGMQDATLNLPDGGEALPLNDTDAQLETFWTTYGGRQTFPASYIAAVETLLRAEDDVERGDLAAARLRVERVLADYPLSTAPWWAGVRQAETNVGTPVAYYGLRMLDEITKRAEASDAQNVSLRMTVVMPRCAQGMRPTSADLTSEEAVTLSLDPRLELDEHRLIRQSLRLFQHYVRAITGGAMLTLTFVTVDDCVSVVYRSNPSYSGIENANAAIDQVPATVQAATDMWWVLYPSNVPSGVQFDKTAFITGGMGGRGRAPVFIIDDQWLVRKPPHLGRGPYTDVERRVYLPQWLQHEFFHHLFRTWPELGLEATGHQWFDRKTWPEDFVGEWEPDYYAEGLNKRLYAVEPSLTSALRVALPSFDASVLTAQDLVGTYERRPVENGWHRVTISLTAGQLRWRNDANVEWPLVWADGSLRTEAGSPYGKQTITIEPTRDAGGNPSAVVHALYFNGDSYRRL